MRNFSMGDNSQRVSSLNLTLNPTGLGSNGFILTNIGIFFFVVNKILYEKKFFFLCFHIFRIFNEPKK